MKTILTHTALWIACIGLIHADPPPAHGHLSDWAIMPTMFETIEKDPNELPLEHLHQLTFLRLGTAELHGLEAHEQKECLQQTRQNWLNWWESTGKPISEAKEKHAKADAEAFKIAWAFLHPKRKQPKKVNPVWIPPTWTLYLTFRTGDYGAQEELWIMDRQESEASLSKLSGSSGWVDTSVSHQTLKGFTPQRADQVLKAIHYLHRHAPESAEGIEADEMPKLYYPNAGLRLMDGKDRLLWNTKGYDFTKSIPKFGEGIAGRTLYFMHQTFSQARDWKVLTQPESSQLALHRKFLFFSKPGRSDQTGVILQWFEAVGHTPEIEAMFNWAEKQKLAVDRNMHWKVRTDEFGVSQKASMVNWTRSTLASNLNGIRMAVARLQGKQAPQADDALLQQYNDRISKLEDFVAKTQALEKKEKEDAIMSFPQPLRALIRVDRQQRDSDLKNMSHAMNEIRTDPDPKLFRQLAEAMGSGGVSMKGLMSAILINEHSLYNLEPWKSKQESIAIEACIDALAHINQDAKEDMIIILLASSGGGVIQIQEEDGGGRKIEVPKGGKIAYSLSHADIPQSVETVQKQLRELYKQSRKIK